VITGAHFVFYSSDADRDRAFFRDVLGLRAIDAGHGWLIFAMPPSETAFHPGAGVPAQTEHLLSAELYLMCDDLAATMESLRTKNVIFSPVKTERWGHRTSLRLPSGGEIGLYQPTHPTAIGPA